MKDKKEKPEGYVLGRPTKYRKEYCEQLVEWMREGKSFWTFASTIPCSIDTICEWTHQHEEFSEAKKSGSRWNKRGGTTYIDVVRRQAKEI